MPYKGFDKGRSRRESVNKIVAYIMGQSALNYMVESVANIVYKILGVLPLIQYADISIGGSLVEIASA